jgi:hypothetical protein
MSHRVLLRCDHAVDSAVIPELRSENWPLGDKTETMHFFLVERFGCGRANDWDRQHRWITRNDLDLSAVCAETRDLVQLADALRAKARRR